MRTLNFAQRYSCKMFAYFINYVCPATVVKRNLHTIFYLSIIKRTHKKRSNGLNHIRP